MELTITTMEQDIVTMGLVTAAIRKHITATIPILATEKWKISNGFQTDP
jgi:hypothetical protein